MATVRFAAGELPGRLLPANAFVHAPHPQGLTVRGIDGGGNAASRGHREKAPVRVQRGRAVVLIGPERSDVPLPRLFQRLEIRRVDLVEGGVSRAPRVRAPVPPFSGRVAPHQGGGLRSPTGLGEGGERAAMELLAREARL